MNESKPDYQPKFREVTREIIEHLPTALHKALAQDNVKRGLWRLKE